MKNHILSYVIFGLTLGIDFAIINIPGSAWGVFFIGAFIAGWIEYFNQ